MIYIKYLYRLSINLLLQEIFRLIIITYAPYVKCIWLESID